MILKVHFQSTTELHCNEDKSLYDLFMMIKSQCDFTNKPGFLSKPEIKSLSTKFYNNKTSTVYSRLNRLSRFGYIQKTKWGYTLTSTQIVLNNLTNFKLSKTKAGNHYHPYAKIEVPDTSDTSIIELLKLYYLLRQKNNREQKSNGINVKRSDYASKKHPERLRIALGYLMKAGKYSSKTMVDNYLRKLESIGLIRIARGKFNHNVNSYDMNEYTIFDESVAKWKVLTKTPRHESVEGFMKSLSIGITKPKKVFKTTKIKTEITDLQKRFINFIERVLNRKIRTNWISKYLNSVLSDNNLKALFLSEFEIDNVMVNTKHRSIYDRYASGDHRNTTYCISVPHLVEKGGNYNGETLTSYDQALSDTKNKRIEFLFFKVASTISYVNTSGDTITTRGIFDETGGDIIEDVEDYYIVLDTLREHYYGDWKHYVPLSSHIL
jgi:hypothetical protein